MSQRRPLADLMQLKLPAFPAKATKIVGKYFGLQKEDPTGICLTVMLCNRRGELRQVMCRPIGYFSGKMDEYCTMNELLLESLLDTNATSTGGKNAFAMKLQTAPNCWIGLACSNVSTQFSLARIVAILLAEECGFAVDVHLSRELGIVRELREYIQSEISAMHDLRARRRARAHALAPP